MSGEQEPRGESGFRPWQQAWQDALYGPDGFYLRAEGPAGHFRTAAHASSGGLLARALVELALRAGCSRVVDVGAGRGELLTALHAVAPELALHGVDVVERPPHLPEPVAWSTDVGDLPDETTGTLLVAWELLDVVPCAVLEADSGRSLRVVEVAADGRERLGADPEPADLAWCRTWWPGPYAPGQRVEVGRARETVWAGLRHAVGQGLALAVDYDHARGERPTAGTLSGFRAGRQVAPAPDGRSDLTAHVALDALPGAGDGRLLRQHEALRRLGLVSSRPNPSRAAGDPRGYLLDLSAASEAAELLDADGLGGFGWLLLPIGPAARRALDDLGE